MSFFIAQRNKDSGKFELWHDGDKPDEYHDESHALKTYEMILKQEGSNNVKLLEELIIDVDLSIKRYIP